MKRGVEMEAAEMEEDVGLEPFPVTILIGSFYQTLNLVVWVCTLLQLAPLLVVATRLNGA